MTEIEKASTHEVQQWLDDLRVRIEKYIKNIAKKSDLSGFLVLVESSENGCTQVVSVMNDITSHTIVNAIKTILSPLSEQQKASVLLQVSLATGMVPPDLKSSLTG